MTGLHRPCLRVRQILHRHVTRGTVMDRVRAEMLHRVGLPELLSPVKAK